MAGNLVVQKLRPRKIDKRDGLGCRYPGDLSRCRCISPDSNRDRQQGNGGEHEVVVQRAQPVAEVAAERVKEDDRGMSNNSIVLDRGAADLHR